MPAKGPSAVSKSIVTGHLTSPISLVLSVKVLACRRLLSVIEVSLEDDQTALGQIGEQLWSDIRHVLISVLGGPEVIETKLGIEWDRQSELARREIGL